MLRLWILSFLVLLAACDGGLGGSTPFAYATDGTDVALDLVQDADGALVVVGSTEGAPRPADGTLALPTVLRFGLDGALASSEVYRDIGFGDATAVVSTGDGLVVAVASGPDDGTGRALRLYRTDRQGRRDRVLIQPETASYAPPRALLAAPDGGVYAAVYANLVGGPTLYRLSRSGDVVWAGRLDETPDVRALAPAPGGLYAMGPERLGSGTVVARLGADGAERWRIVRSGVLWQTTHLAATPDGLALLESRWSHTEGAAVRVVRVTAGGGVEDTVTVAETPRSPGPNSPPSDRVWGTALAALPGGGLAVGLAEGGGALDGPPPGARVVTLGADGAVRSRRPFGVRGRWTGLAALFPLADGRLAAAGAVGPRTVSGYGGDDFDVRVEVYPSD